MPCYHVELEFSIVHAQCDPVSLVGTPEQIAAHTEGLTVTLMSEHQGIRTYCAVLKVEAASETNLTHVLIGHFDHLPQFVPGTMRVDGLEASSDGPDLGIADDVALDPFRLQCHFKSELPFEVLKTGFIKHIAIGNLVSNAGMAGEFVAFVSLNAISTAGLEGIVEELLSKAFDANTDKSAANFCPITTKLV